MRLYDYERAPSPRRVRMFMVEKGLDLPRIQVDIAAGEQLADDFRRLNPECTVPVLELDDGRAISEVLAICDYLEHQVPQPPLMGRVPEERAEVLMWNARIEQQGLAAIAEAFRNSVRGLAGRALPGPDPVAQIPALAERGKARAQAFFSRLDEHLETREFIAGGGFSMADITALVAVDFAAWIKLSLTDSRPGLRRWYEGIAARPSARA